MNIEDRAISRSKATAIRKADQIINLFRGMDNTIPSQVISVFLAVAKVSLDEELETRRIPEKVGLSHAATQRALTYLGDTHWKDKEKPGLNLTTYRVSLRDARQRVVELTPKGRKLVHQIDEIINGT